MSDGPSERIATLGGENGIGAADAAPVVTTRRPGRSLGAAELATGDRFWRDAKRRRLLAVADLAAAAVASIVAVSGIAYATWALLFLPVWVVIAKLIGLYDRDHRSIRHLTLDEIPSIAAWAGLGMAGLGIFMGITDRGVLTVPEAVVAGAVALVCGAIFRAGARMLYRRTTAPELTAVIGDGQLAWAARRKVELFSDLHLELAPGPPLHTPGEGGVDETMLRELAGQVDRIVVASDHMDPEWIGVLAELCREAQAKLSVVSPLRGPASAAPRLSEIADLPVLEYDTWDVSRSAMLIKRVFDVLVAAVAMIVLIPLLPLVAVAIKLDSRGPVFFRQRRAGLDGAPFMVWKLRTMNADAEEKLGELVDLDALDEPMFKLRDDPRVTRIGRFLRRFSIDELPQLLNVLRGEMSLVGPRPEVMEVVERYHPEDYVRFAVRPGMTGPMQVFGRGALTFTERMAVELDYIDNLSLSRDLRIIGQTIPAIIRGTGAY
jgi:exopolysaccharide biosynthesis polyprenyl glycosylphosphotransferase